MALEWRLSQGRHRFAERHGAQWRKPLDPRIDRPKSEIPGGSSGFRAYALAAIAGVPIFVCEREEVPNEYALISRGFGPGPSLAFLLGSVGTCIPTMLMARNVIGR